MTTKLPTLSNFYNNISSQGELSLRFTNHFYVDISLTDSKFISIMESLEPFGNRLLSNIPLLAQSIDIPDFESNGNGEFETSHGNTKYGGTQLTTPSSNDVKIEFLDIEQGLHDSFFLTWLDFVNDTNKLYNSGDLNSTIIPKATIRVYSLSQDLLAKEGADNQFEILTIYTFHGAFPISIENPSFSHTGGAESNKFSRDVEFGFNRLTLEDNVNKFAGGDISGLFKRLSPADLRYHPTESEARQARQDSFLKRRREERETERKAEELRKQEEKKKTEEAFRKRREEIDRELEAERKKVEKYENVKSAASKTIPEVEGVEQKASVRKSFENADAKSSASKAKIKQLEQEKLSVSSDPKDVSKYQNNQRVDQLEKKKKSPAGLSSRQRQELKRRKKKKKINN